MREMRVTDQVADVLQVLIDADGRGEELYGTQIVRLSGRKLGTVYPILQRLEANELIVPRRETRQEWRDRADPTGGSPRVYYQVAPGKADAIRRLISSSGRRLARPVLVFEGVPEESTEDGGAALILEMGAGQRGVEEFVRLQSWYFDGSHPVLSPLAGRRLRFTVETVDEQSEAPMGEWQARFEHLQRTHGCACDSPNDGLLVEDCSRHGRSEQLLQELETLAISLHLRAVAAPAEAAEPIEAVAAALDRLLDASGRRCACGELPHKPGHARCGS